MGIATNRRCSTVTYARSATRRDGSTTPSSHDPVLRDGLSALIIDGSEFQRIYHRTLLSAFGVDIWEVKNGYEALDLVLGGIEFDVIFIDMDLTYLSGAATVRLLRLLGVRSVIVGIAAYRNRESDQEMFMRSGLSDYYEQLVTYEILYIILCMIDDGR